MNYRKISFAVFFVFLSISLQAQRILDKVPESAVRTALIGSMYSMPTNAQIEAAHAELKGRIPSNSQALSWKKYHTPWGGSPEQVNKVIAIVHSTYTRGPRPVINQAMVLKQQSDGSFRFEGVFMPGVIRYKGDTGSLLEEEDIGYLQSGWISGSSSGSGSSGQQQVPSGGYDTNDDWEDLPFEEDDLWTIIIGALAAGLVGAIIRRLLKRKKEGEKDPSEFILQLNKNVFQLEENKAQILEAHIWKITTKGKSLAKGTIGILNNEKNLSIRPSKGANPLKVQLILKGATSQPSFNIVVQASAEGKTVRETVQIQSKGDWKIVITTSPADKHTVRPDIKDYITCEAKVVDGQGMGNLALTEGIQVKPQSDWADLYDPVLKSEKYTIAVGASNPAGHDISSKPPKTIGLRFWVNDPETDKTLAEKEFSIPVADCILDVNNDQISFPATGKSYTRLVKAYIENCDGATPWHFAAKYQRYGKPDDPLTKISIKEVSTTEAEITLTGPILLPTEKESAIHKTLVVEAYQGKEEPLERHIQVSVSTVGLFINNGTNEKDEIAFTAKGDIEMPVEFSLFRYKENSDEIAADPEGLSELSFEMEDADRERINLASVLQPRFVFDQLTTTIPLGRYHLKAKEEIPGFGDILSIKYKVRATISGDEEPEDFTKIITLKIKTHGIGEEFPEWVEAYRQCQHVIFNFVPPGPASKKLTEILEQRKYTLGKEGLTELR
ncbi:MAG: FeoB-associated Cys-rich membrane protein, partial [Saprospiraceae bacterium]|nr:FeoB-associated Cys-rich membrane protein [Saprospiraceae bacterium]